MKQFKGIFVAKVSRGDVYYRHEEDYHKYLEQHDGVDMQVSFTPFSKSSEKERMYAYYHKVIIGCTIMALTNDGWAGIDEVAADLYLKMNVAKKVFYNAKNKKVMESYESKSEDMSKERLHKFISDCIMLLWDRHQMTCPDSEEYKTGFTSSKKQKP